MFESLAVQESHVAWLVAATREILHLVTSGIHHPMFLRLAIDKRAEFEVQHQVPRYFSHPKSCSVAC